MKFAYLLTAVHLFVAATAYGQSYRSTRKTIYRDTANRIVKKEQFFELYSSGKYTMRPLFDTVRHKVIAVKLLDRSKMDTVYYTRP